MTYFKIFNIYFNMKNEEIKYVGYQLIVLLLTILAGCVSFFITYNQRRALQGKKRLVSPKNLFLISFINRIVFLITGSLFLLVNFKLYEISKRENENLRTYELQIIASVLVVISEIIALYVSSKSTTGQVSDVENPNI